MGDHKRRHTTPPREHHSGPSSRAAPGSSRCSNNWDGSTLAADTGYPGRFTAEWPGANSMDIDHEEFNNNTTPHDMFQQSYSTDHSAGTLLFSSNYPGAATAPRDGYAPGPYSSSTWVGNDTNVSGTFDAAPTHHNTPASGLHTLDGHSDSDPGSGEHEDNEPFGGGHGTMHEAIKAELSEEPEQETPARPTRKGRPRKTSPGKGDRKSRRRHHDTRRTLSPHNAGVRGDRKKRSKLPPELRGETARARQLHCCLRCRNQRIRCKEDPQNPSGPCLTCKSISRPTLSQLPCIRAIVTQGVLYREQHCPNPLHTKRWKEFPPPGKLPEDIPEHDFVPGAPVRWVQISHVVLPGCAYTIGVRAYYPRELIDRTWECWEQQDPVTGKGSVVYHECPVFAIANVAETAAMIRKFLEDNIETYVNGFIGKLGELHIRTYDEAMRHARESEEAEERELLRNVLLLWTACRKVSNIEYLCGDDRLDGVPVSDPSSPWEGMVPMPPIMIGQFEAIIYSTILRPLNKTVLDQLQAFFLAPKRKHWYTVYLALFVLLHSCSMLTRRNSEFAAKIDWPLPYMNPFSIKKLHFSAVILIAHFHYISRGERPFDNAMEFTSTSLKENEGFTQQQLEFIKLTADLVRQRESEMKKVLRDDDGRHDLFWIAQLYDREWKPELEKYSIESVYKMGFPAWLGKGQYGPAQTSGSDSAQDSAFDFGQGYGINAGKGNAVDTGLGSVEVKVEGEFTPT